MRMKNLNKQEKDFRDILQQVSYDLDHNAIWDDINHRLPQKKKKRPVWLFLLGVIALLIAVVLSVTSYNNMKSNSSIAEVAIDDASLNVTRGLRPDNSNVNTNKISDSSIPVDVKLLEQSVSISQGANVQESMVASSRSRYQGNVINNSSYLEKTNLTNNTFATPLSSIVLNKGYNTSVQFDNASSNIASDISHVATREVMPSISKLSMFIDIRNSQAINVKPRMVLYVSMDVIVEKPTLLALSIGSGANKSYSSYSTTDTRNNGFGFENGKYGYNLELMASMENASGWRLSGGLSFTQLSYQYNNAEQNVEVRTDVTGHQDFVIDGEGNRQAEDINAELVTITNYDINWFRYNRDLDLNINLSKRIQLNEKFSLYPTLGVAVNLASHNSGYYFSDNLYDIEKYESQASNPYNSRSGYKANIGMSLETKISKNISLYMRPSFQYNVSNRIVNENYNLRESNTNFVVGIRYRG